MSDDIVSNVAGNLIAQVLTCLFQIAVANAPNLFARAKGKTLFALRTGAVAAMTSLIASLAFILLKDGDANREWITSLALCSIATSVSASSIIAHYIGRRHAWSAFGYSLELHEGNMETQKGTMRTIDGMGKILEIHGREIQKLKNRR